MLRTKNAKVQSTDTRTRIMIAAFELFGRHGFGGTSIRQIAHKSEVNLAAVNYHFKSKENLFWEIMRLTFSEVETTVSEMAAESKTTLELAEKIYDLFIQESLAMKNTMKMMLTEDIEPPAFDENSPLTNPMGPPGGQHLALKIQADIPYPMNLEATLWGVKAIFGAIFHWALLVSTDRVCQKEQNPLMSEAQIKKDVLRMVTSSLAYIKSNRAEFEA